MNNKAEPFLPKFFTMPFSVAVDPDLQPIDRMVFGAVFMYQKWKHKSCTASNATLASTLGVHTVTVSKAVNRLLDLGYLQRDVSKRIRTLTIRKGSNSTNRLSNLADSLKDFDQTAVQVNRTEGVTSIRRANGSIATVGKPPVPAPQKTELQALVGLYFDLYRRKITKERDPYINWKQCGMLSKGPLKSIGLGRLAILLEYYLDSDDPFWERKGWPLSLFLTGGVLHALNSKDGPIIVPKYTRRA